MKQFGLILGVIMKSKSILLFAGLAFLTYKNQAQMVIDYDGNMYDTVIIGTQVWLPLQDVLGRRLTFLLRNTSSVCVYGSL